MARYNHAYTLAFSLVSNDDKGHDVDARQLKAALLARIENLDEEDRVLSIRALLSPPHAPPTPAIAWASGCSSSPRHPWRPRHTPTSLRSPPSSDAR